MLHVPGWLLIIILVNVIVHKLRQLKEKNLNDQNTLSSPPSDSHCHRFSLAQIHSATHYFDEACVIGKGGFAKVYKGVIQEVGTVAIKRLDCGKSKQREAEFWAEIEMLSKFRHSHLVALIGYCSEDDEMILVYEYMPLGSLFDYLHKGGGPLTWVQRLKICIGAARGLHYLHTGTGIQDRVIHRDVKTSNILLDDNLQARISDFGLSKIGPANQTQSHVITCLKGTLGYIDPDYIKSWRLTSKSDVYAFGVVLFEILCGRMAVDYSFEENQQGLAGWALDCITEGNLDQIVDRRLRGQILSSCLKEFGGIAAQCLHNNPRERPTMAEVVVRLEHSLKLQEDLDFSVDENEIDGIARNEFEDETAKDDLDVIVNNSGAFVNQVKMDIITNGDSWLKQKNLRESVATENDATGRLSRIKETSTMTFPKKLMHFLLGKTRVTSETNAMIMAEFQVRSIRFKTIKAATNNFSSDNKIGEGRFGSIFKGRLPDGIAIAVNRISATSTQQNVEFIEKACMVGALRHPNLVKLWGFCVKDSHRLLVYEYMENNSLQHALFGSEELKKRLDWGTRVKICQGIAKGLAFLHEEPKLVHGNLKPTNILLDEYLTAKISGFGFAELFEAEATDMITRCIGPMVYIAPEYALRGILTYKADVYSFGVVLLQIVSGKDNARCILYDENELLLDMALILQRKGNLIELVDPELEEYSWDEAYTILNLALLCTAQAYTMRPSMSQVVKMLQGEMKISDYTNHHLMDVSCY